LPPRVLSPGLVLPKLATGHCCRAGPTRQPKPDQMTTSFSRLFRACLLVAMPMLMLGAANAQDQAAALAKKLSNPVAALISVPLQANLDQRFGPQRDGHRLQLNIQPVVPISLDAQWNLISRTILPLISQDDVVPGTSASGLGDTVQSLFLSPVQPTAGGLIWGVGPVFLLPTGTQTQLSARKWGLGPTAVALKQDGAWTYGMLANHIWSVAGSDSRQDISTTFLQPFVSYTTPTAWTFTLNTESTYDWERERWAVPVNGVVSKLLKVGEQPLSIGAGLRWWAEGPEAGPHGLGFRLVVTFLFPK
jgi:hypothetical protein